MRRLLYSTYFVRKPQSESCCMRSSSRISPCSLQSPFLEVDRRLQVEYVEVLAVSMMQDHSTLQQALAHARFLFRLTIPSLHPVRCAFQCRFESAVPGSCHQRFPLQRRCACPPRCPLPFLLLPSLASWNSLLARDCCLGRKISYRLVRPHRER